MDYYKILQNRETIIDYERMCYSHMKDVNIKHNYIIKELDDIEIMHEVEVIINKALKIAINKLVENQVQESEGLKNDMKKLKYNNNMKRHYLKKDMELTESNLK